tara:strand:- start:2562 stop:3428 length:867 start_codon:yes stop_codon:yes gene_type:complete
MNIVPDNIPNINESNEIIKKYIKNDKPFTIVRAPAETIIALKYKQSGNISNQDIKILSEFGGIYANNITLIKNFLDIYLDATKNGDILSCFTMYQHVENQKYLSEKYNLQKIFSRSIEPWYACMENVKPWTLDLYDKKVLIISPFTDSFQKQIKNNFKIFKDKEIFHSEQKFHFYKCYQTSAGNHIHSSWLETFTIMCNDIKKLDFDIAMLGCGGYGLPLCDYIKRKLNKSAIYIGGGLQLMFGVMGKRWENREDWKQIIAENKCNFIRPSGDEIIKSKHLLEGGCYW